MKTQFFVGRGRNGERIHVPEEYRRKAAWLPRIGDVFPDFDATTTHGRMKLSDWADGKWTFLFSHPMAYTAVCTTEILSIAEAASDFAALDAQVLGITSSPVDEQKAWHEDVSRTFDVPVDIRVAEDPTGTLSRAIGAVHPDEIEEFPIRKSFILDPQMRVRMIFEYPENIGRSVDEVLRCISALRAAGASHMATPADWSEGDPLVHGRRAPGADNSLSPPGGNQLTPYLRVVRYEPAA